MGAKYVICFQIYIANDAIGNIYISQSGNINGSVLALGMDGHCRFLNKGDMEKHGFMPLGICADKAGLVFVINAFQRNIHVIDKEGTLSLLLRTDCNFLPFGISMNTEGFIWTCSGNDILHWIFLRNLISETFPTKRRYIYHQFIGTNIHYLHFYSMA